LIRLFAASDLSVSYPINSKITPTFFITVVIIKFLNS